MPTPRLRTQRRSRRVDLAAVLLAPAGVLVILLSQLFDGGRGTALLQGSAALIVFGGTLGAVLLTYSPGDVLAACRAAMRAFQRPDKDSGALVSTLVSMSIRAHRRGVLALEHEADTIDDPFFREALALAVDGTSRELFRDLVVVEKSARDADDEAPARVFESAAGYAPTMGILGAVLGLMRVMQNIGSPSSLGDGIAVAFVATVYGVGAANLVLLPVAGRLRESAARAARRREVIVHGIDAILRRLHPRLVARRLQVFSENAPRVEEIARQIPQVPVSAGHLA
jgi:chemotaxis protein MotA